MAQATGDHRQARWGSGVALGTIERSSGSTPFSGSWRGSLVSGQVLPTARHALMGARRGGGLDDNDMGWRHLLPLNQSESQFPFPGDLTTILRTRGVSFWASESPIPPRLADRSQVHGPFQATRFG